MKVRFFATNRDLDLVRHAGTRAGREAVRTPNFLDVRESIGAACAGAGQPACPGGVAGA